MSQHPAHSQDQRHPGQPNPVDIQKALAGITYPTTREKLVERTRLNHANTDHRRDRQAPGSQLRQPVGRVEGNFARPVSGKRRFRAERCGVAHHDHRIDA